MTNELRERTSDWILSKYVQDDVYKSVAFERKEVESDNSSANSVVCSPGCGVLIT